MEAAAAQQANHMPPHVLAGHVQKLKAELANSEVKAAATALWHAGSRAPSDPAALEWRNTLRLRDYTSAGHIDELIKTPAGSQRALQEVQACRTLVSYTIKALEGESQSDEALAKVQHAGRRLLAELNASEMKIKGQLFAQCPGLQEPFPDCVPPQPGRIPSKPENARWRATLGLDDYASEAHVIHYANFEGGRQALTSELVTLKNLVKDQCDRATRDLDPASQRYKDIEAAANSLRAEIEASRLHLDPPQQPVLLDEERRNECLTRLGLVNSTSNQGTPVLHVLATPPEHIAQMDFMQIKQKLEDLGKFKSELSTGYRRASLKHHPDKGGDQLTFNAVTAAKTELDGAATTLENLLQHRAAFLNRAPDSNRTHF
jgi:hypothetical protein